LPALLVGSVTALCVTVLLLRRSILTEKLARRGQHIAREYSVDLFEMARVRDVMDADVTLIPGSTGIAEIAERIAAGDDVYMRRHGLLLSDAQGELAGVITRGDIMAILQEGTGEHTTALEVANTDLVVAYPDETLHEAIAKMLTRDIGRLPVVERSAPRKVIGYLGRGDILAARMKLHHEEELRERGPLQLTRRLRGLAN
jgi:CBS domain-containing protein